MVSADNLNLDVLELIFAYLDQHDLFHLCLVSQNFLAAATPLLYRAIEWDLHGGGRFLKPALRVSFPVYPDTVKDENLWS